MNNKYIKIKSDLYKCEFNYEKEENVNSVEIAFDDKLILNKIEENKIRAKLQRNLSFKPLVQTYVKVYYELTIETASEINKDTFFADIRKGIPLLANVFSRTSLVISQLTNASVFGPVITPPGYDNHKIELE